MRLAPGTVIVFGKIAEIYPNPISAQRQAGGRRAGLKIRWGNTRVGSRTTFGIRAALSERLATPDRQAIFMMMSDHRFRGADGGEGHQVLREDNGGTRQLRGGPKPQEQDFARPNSLAARLRPLLYPFEEESP